MKIGSRVQEILRKVSGGYFYPPKATIKLAKPSATMRVNEWSCIARLAGGLAGLNI